MVEAKPQMNTMPPTAAGAKTWLGRALFPVSVGTVVAELAPFLAMFLDEHGTTGKISGWAGLAAAASVFLFQAATRKKQ